MKMAMNLDQLIKLSLVPIISNSSSICLMMSPHSIHSFIAFAFRWWIFLYFNKKNHLIDRLCCFNITTYLFIESHCFFSCWWWRNCMTTFEFLRKPYRFIKKNGYSLEELFLVGQKLSLASNRVGSRKNCPMLVSDTYIYMAKLH